MSKKHGILIIICIFLIILSGISIIFYVNLKNNKTIEIEATVKILGDNYIVVQDDDGQKYNLTTSDEYKIGDRVDFLLKNPKTKNKYIEGTLVKIETISKDINFYITDNYNEENYIEDNDKDNDKTTNNNIILDEIKTEIDVVNYLNNLNNELDTYEQDQNIASSLKEGFITVIDFIFYDGKIEGITFDELSTSAKIKVLQVAFSIDKKIEKHFPNYKETISTNGKKIYSNVKEETIKLYLDITTKVCEDNSDVCQSAKEGLSDLKKSFSLTWDYIKKYSKEGTNKLKEWYKVWKEA